MTATERWNALMSKFVERENRERDIEQDIRNKLAGLDETLAGRPSWDARREDMRDKGPPGDDDQDDQQEIDSGPGEWRYVDREELTDDDDDEGDRSAR